MFRQNEKYGGSVRWASLALAVLIALSVLIPIVAPRQSEPSQGQVTSSVAVTRTPSPLPMADPNANGLVNSGYDEKIDQEMNQAISDGKFPGGVVLVAHDGSIDKIDGYGNAVLYDANGKRVADPIATSPDTIYDIASVTKTFTATSVMKLVENGQVDLDAPVSKYIPEFSANGKDKITVRQLLTHTSGLPAGAGLSGVKGTEQDREAALYRIKPTQQPGVSYVYSDVNFMVLGKLVERVSGQPLDVFENQQFFEPLGMKDTMYNPPADLKDRIAATELNPAPGRGLVWGQVQDGEAYALNGVSGNAGLFSTARDMAVFSQMIINGGEYGGVRVLEPETVSAMLKPQSTSTDGHVMGLGWELDETWYMGSLGHGGAAGHTGYTGTCITINPKTNTTVAVLTNRVHPTCSGPSINSVRADIGNFVALGLDA